MLAKALAPLQVDGRAAGKVVGQYELARFSVSSFPDADEAQVFCSFVTDLQCPMDAGWALIRCDEAVRAKRNTPPRFFSLPDRVG